MDHDVDEPAPLARVDPDLDERAAVAPALAQEADDAEAAALVLLVLSLMLFWIFDRGGRVNAAT